MRALIWLLYKEIAYHRAYPLDLISLAISPFFIVGPFVYAAKMYPENVQVGVAIGLIVWYWFSMFFWGVGYGVRDEVEEGTFESLLGAPISLWQLLVAKALDTTLVNVYITSFLVLLLRWGAGVYIPLHKPGFALMFGTSCFALTSFAFLYAALAIIARQAAMLGNLVQETLGILSGMTAPTSVFPKILQWCAAAIPLTYAIRGTRRIVQGQMPYFEALVLLLFGCVLLAVGMLAVFYVEHYLRETGTGGEY